MDHCTTRSISGTVKLSNARDRSSRHIAPSVRTNLVKKCWQDVRRFWANLRRERRIRKAAVQLTQFDDRLLRDMGIDRCRIERAVRYGRDYHDGPNGKGAISRSCVSLQAAATPLVRT